MYQKRSRSQELPFRASLREQASPHQADRISRKMDMLNSDLHMKNEVIAKKQSKKTRPGGNQDDAGFHFIAYVPIDDNVWKLDGLERQPQKLGTSQPF